MDQLATGNRELSREAAYIIELCAITARYKEELLETLDISWWKPEKYDGFRAYERVAENSSVFVIGNVPETDLATVQEFATVIPSLNYDRDRKVYFAMHPLIHDYLEHTAKGRPKSMESAIITCSHFIDLCLAAPAQDFPLLFAAVNFNSLLEALQAEELGYVQTLSDDQKDTLRKLTADFRDEVETLRERAGEERPILGDSLVPDYRKRGLLQE